MAAESVALPSLSRALGSPPGYPVAERLAGSTSDPVESARAASDSTSGRGEAFSMTCVYWPCSQLQSDLDEHVP